MPVEVKNKEKYVEWLEALSDPGDNYTLGKIHGDGNSGVVYEAQDAEGKLVAVKVVEEHEETWEDLYEENSLLAEVGSNDARFPNLIGTHRVITSSPRQIWFILELCGEGSIENLLLKLRTKEKTLDENIISYVLKEVVLAVQELHTKCIIHRDIRASNILICSDGRIKLCDLGLARKVQSSDGRMQSVAGSPYWMAPEVAVSDRSPELAYDSRADVWSIGITAAELGDGSAPLAQVYAPRALFQVVQNPPPTLKKPADWSQLYNDFIAECLEKNIDHRPWVAEIAEHPFINENMDTNVAKASLLKLLDDLRSEVAATKDPEVLIRSDYIKMNRQQPAHRLSHDDLATLHLVTEDAVMETLYKRFAQGNIYTYLGDILIVINPFGPEKHGNLYNLEVASRYKYKARCDNAPHIYAIADRAYQDMLHHQELQNIILTGETASGKSTAGSELLWHLANMTASNKKMVEKILNLNTVVQAFTSASTVFNDSATRFIQYLELTFTKTGKLSGGILTGYNLEKWRVTSKGRLDHSNFHIFYYLIDTLTATDQLGKYFLSKGAKYEYLPELPNHKPKENVEKFRRVKEALNILDFSLEEQETIISVLCAILLLGQVKFSEEGETKITNPETVDHVASLLNVDKKKLGWTFINFCVVASGEIVRGKCNHSEAVEMRDSLARSLYCRLFDWVVNLINTKLSLTRLVFGDQNNLAILDMPGFECFAYDNTLDQFLVNMTNEQMQFFYNQRVFAWEMQDYEREKLQSVSYTYHENRELLDLTLSKPIGILAFLDDETKTSSNDHKYFINQIETKLQTKFVRKIDDASFHVAHYSGQVTYDARNFVERNKNLTSPEMVQVMRSSENSTIVQLFSNLMTKTGNLTINDDDVKQTRWTSAFCVTSGHPKRFNTTSRGKFSQSRQMQTIAGTTRNALLELLQRVSCGSAHFVRCIRSNLKRQDSVFDRNLVKYQLRALGIVDSIRVRQLGYSRRLKFAEFLKRYKFLAFDFDETVEDTRDNCRLLLIRLKMEGWALGAERVFLKYYNEEYLSRLYENQVNKVVKIQAMMRAFLARKKATAKFPRLASLRQATSSLLETYDERHSYSQQRRHSSAETRNLLNPSYSSSSTRTTTPILYEGSECSSGSARPRRGRPEQVSRSYRAETATEHLTLPSTKSSSAYVRATGGYNQPAYNAPVSFNRPGGLSVLQQRQAFEANNEVVRQDPTPKLTKPKYSDFRPQNSTSVIHIAEPQGTLKHCLTPPEIDTARPPSPREIAKAFEAAARENEKNVVAGRYKPGYSIPAADNAGARGRSSEAKPGQSLKPEVISPLEEFTSMASKFGGSKPDLSGCPSQRFDFSGGSSGRRKEASKNCGTQRVVLSEGVVIVDGICEDL